MIDVTATLLARLEAAGLPHPVLEFQFHPHRKWRFDAAYPYAKVEPCAIEIEGGLEARSIGGRVQPRGRHVRKDGYQNDLDKYNSATAMGWRIFRFSHEDIQQNSRTFVLSLNAIKQRILG